MKIIWPWQWKKIAEQTLAELQKTRAQLKEAEHALEADRKKLADVTMQNLRLRDQVRAMSER